MSLISDRAKAMLDKIAFNPNNDADWDMVELADQANAAAGTRGNEPFDPEKHGKYVKWAVDDALWNMESVFKYVNYAAEDNGFAHDENAQAYAFEYAQGEGKRKLRERERTGSRKTAISEETARRAEEVLNAAMRRMQERPELIQGAHDAYDRQDQEWFNSLSIDDLVYLNEVNPMGINASWDDEVMDALYFKGHFGSRKTAAVTDRQTVFVPLGYANTVYEAEEYVKEWLGDQGIIPGMISRDYANKGWNVEILKLDGPLVRVVDIDTRLQEAQASRAPLNVWGQNAHGLDREALNPQSGHGESDLDYPEVPNEHDDEPMWPWEIGDTEGFVESAKQAVLINGVDFILSKDSYTNSNEATCSVCGQSMNMDRAHDHAVKHSVKQGAFGDGNKAGYSGVAAQAYENGLSDAQGGYPFHPPSSYLPGDPRNEAYDAYLAGWRKGSEGQTQRVFDLADKMDAGLASRKRATTYGGGDVPNDLIDLLNERQYGGKATANPGTVTSRPDLDGATYSLNGVTLVGPYGESGTIYTKGDGWVMEFYDGSFLTIRRSGDGGYLVTTMRGREERLGSKTAASEGDIINCEFPGCKATFLYVPARKYPNLCIEHSDDKSREEEGWTPFNSLSTKTASGMGWNEEGPGKWSFVGPTDEAGAVYVVGSGLFEWVAFNSTGTKYEGMATSLGEAKDSVEIYMGLKEASRTALNPQSGHGESELETPEHPNEHDPSAMWPWEITEIGESDEKVAQRDDSDLFL